MLPGVAEAQQENITTAVTIQQQDVAAGKVPLIKIIDSGAHFFSYPYFLADGWGEGADGPRAWQRKALYPNSPFSPYAGKDGKVPPPIPFLRVNGIDSQSCYECHTSIGATQQPDVAADTPTRTQPAIGGSAGIANNAFINDQFPNPITELIRNPPHVFGTGYTQALANQMTAELFATRLELEAKAKAAGVGKPVSGALSAKGLPFGSLTVTYQADGGYAIDTSQVDGVATDLVVRPFQWKGIASSVRHFVSAATQFHFSMEAVELVGVGVDHDQDGVINELSYGNVGALTTFVAMTRPPIVVAPADAKGKAQAERGRALFTGTATGLPKDAGQMCVTCHIPERTIQPVVTIEYGTVYDVAKQEPTTQVGSDAGIELPKHLGTSTAAAAAAAPQGPTRVPTLTTPVPSSEHLPIIRRLRQQHAAGGLAALRAEAIPAPSDGVQINLNTLQYRVTDGPWLDLDGKPGTNSPESLPHYAQGRLAFKDPQADLAVPLYSDLKLHDMGPCLQDTVSQGTDVSTIAVPPQLFLTRPLWGVGDTWPYLHDGRAVTLMAAIRFHGGKRPDTLADAFPYVCSGSDADPVINAFYQLGDDDQQALIAFLLTQRLPPLPGASVPF